MTYKSDTSNALESQGVINLVISVYTFPPQIRMKFDLLEGIRCQRVALSGYITGSGEACALKTSRILRPRFCAAVWDSYQGMLKAKVRFFYHLLSVV